MPILLIETSTERSIVGFVEHQKVLFEKQLPKGLQNSKYLAPAISEGLKHLNIKMSQVSSIVVGIGPGSYTGIRVGVMLAKSLAFGAQIPLIGVPTLECFVPEVEGAFVVLIDAKISGVYNAAGVYKNEKATYFLKSQVTALNQLDSLLKGAKLIITAQADSLQSKLAPLYPHLMWQEMAPNLLQMAYIAEQQQKEGFETPFELLYLRKTQAEIEKQKDLS